MRTYAHTSLYFCLCKVFYRHYPMTPSITTIPLTLTITSNFYRPTPVYIKVPISVFPTAKVLVINVNANVDTPKGNIYLVFGSRLLFDCGAKLRVAQTHNHLDNVNSTNTFLGHESLLSWWMVLWLFCNPRWLSSDPTPFSGLFFSFFSPMF